MAIVNDLEEWTTGANPEHAPKKSETAQISLKIDPELLDTIKRAAKADGRLVISEYIRLLLVAGLEAKGVKVS
jgi:hypothetical protein